jgi:hypothetical protein
MWYKIDAKVNETVLFEMLHKYGYWIGGVEPNTYQIGGGELYKLIQELKDLENQARLAMGKVKNDPDWVSVANDILSRAKKILDSMKEVASDIRARLAEDFFHAVIEPTFSSFFLSQKIADIWHTLSQKSDDVTLPIRDGYIVVKLPLIITSEPADCLSFNCYGVALMTHKGNTPRGVISIYLNNPATAMEVLEKVTSMTSIFSSITASVETEVNKG